MENFIKKIQKNSRNFRKGFAQAIKDERSNVFSTDDTSLTASCPEILEGGDIYNEYMRKVFYTDNPPVFSWIQAVYVLSGRTSVLGNDVDGLQRPFDPEDDKSRMMLGIEIADKINALIARKKTEELIAADRIIPIFYNGRQKHNNDLYAALEQNQLPYPKHLVEIHSISQDNTIGQAEGFNSFLEKTGIRNVAVVSSGFHLPRVGCTFSEASPLAKGAAGESNALGETIITLYGIDRRYMRPGTDIDIKNEPSAMRNYSSGFGGIKAPTIAEKHSGNVFMTTADILTRLNWETRVKENRLNVTEGNSLG